jgi:hypothetical protein
MSQIRIDGLTAHQIKVVDKLWSMDTHDEVTEWISSLSSAEQKEAITLQQMILDAILEEDITRDDSNSIMAKEMLKSIGVKC